MSTLALLGALTYWNSLSTPFVYDDAATVRENATIRSLSPIGAVLSPPRSTLTAGRPLMNLSLAINYAAGGLDPRGYHALNIAALIACALLLFAIVRRTLATLPDGAFFDATTLAFASAAIWMLHPLQSEVAVYVSARSESLMAFCYLLTLYASIRAAEPHLRASPRALWTTVCVTACAAGMACKESMVTAPLLVVLYDRVFVFGSWREAFGARARLYGGLAATWLVLAAVMWSGPRGHSVGFSVDAGLVPAVSAWVYLLNQTVMIAHYLRLAVWPAGLVLDYGVPRALTLRDVWHPASIIVLLVAAAMLAWVRYPKAGFLGAWFLVTLAPVSSVVPVHTEVGAERRMFLPMMAVAVAVVIAGVELSRSRVDAVERAADRATVRYRWQLALTALLVLTCGGLAAATVRRNAEYASGLSIWKTVVDRWPHGRAWYHLSVELKAAGRSDDALAALRTSVADYPDARSILGIELIDRGQIDEGIAELRAFIRERPSHVNVIVTHGRLAEALFARQRYAEAVAEYQAFLAHRPDHVGSWTNLGIALAASGDAAAAVRAFERTVALEPGNANTHRNLANALLDHGEFAGAAREAAEAVRLAPNDQVSREILALAASGARAAASAPQATAPHHDASGAAPSPAGVLEIAARPTSLRTGIGSAHDSASTSSNEAQAFYDQGLAYLHSYVWLEAARSFNQALRLDAKLALAEIGLTIAYTELNAAPAARAALARAQTLARTPHERRHVSARALQMAAEAAPADAAKLAAYRAALDAALTAFPADEEFWLQRGQAESSDPAERGQGSVAGSVRYYQKALALGPAHFAAHHYLTHAYENSGKVAEALTEGATYAKMAPAVPHARHMDGHNLRRAGRIDEAIAEFAAADALETAYFAAEQIPVEYDWHYQHNLDLLATSYQYSGRMKKAEELFRRSFAIASTLLVQEFNKREWPEFLLARGRAQEALAAAGTMAAHTSPVVSAAGHVEAGRARLALGQFKEAADEGNIALRLMRGSEGGGIVATPLKAFQGEFLLRTGKKDQGRPMLEDVVHKARALPGPDAWAQTLFTIEAIARAARDVGDWDFAAWAARQMLDHDPNYAGTHEALARVAEHAGDAQTARTERALVEKYWKNADPDQKHK